MLRLLRENATSIVIPSRGEFYFLPVWFRKPDGPGKPSVYYHLDDLPDWLREELVELNYNYTREKSEELDDNILLDGEAE